MPMFYELVIKKYSYQKKKRDHFFVFMEEVHLPQTLDLILTILNSEEQKLNCLFFYWKNMKKWKKQTTKQQKL